MQGRQQMLCKTGVSFKDFWLNLQLKIALSSLCCGCIVSKKETAGTDRTQICRRVMGAGRDPVWEECQVGREETACSGKRWISKDVICGMEQDVWNDGSGGKHCHSVPKSFPAQGIPHLWVPRGVGLCFWENQNSGGNAFSSTSLSTAVLYRAGREALFICPFFLLHRWYWHCLLNKLYEHFSSENTETTGGLM